jgi:MYXO-CTERM domain-containing protein
MNIATTSLRGFAGAAIAVFALLPHATARADLSDCGEIELRSEIDCTVVPPSAQCETMCTPVSVQAVCRAQLAVDCQASCNKLPSIDCTASCQAGCTGDCMVDPGKFQCQAACQVDCDGDCDASCAKNSDKTSCMASCSGSCSASCRGKCEVVPPSASCDVQCKASCEGSCTVDPNIDCQVGCQAKGYAGCEAKVTGGCKTQCSKVKKGALFCDGNFVDTGDNLDQCVDSLKKLVSAHVSGMASGTSGCDGGECTASGKASVKSDCSVADVGADAAGGGGAGLGMLLLGALFGWRRRKQN